MNIAIEKGKAIVLQGPQGSGKSQLARKIATAHGTLVETDTETLRSPFRLGKLLAGRPDTVIVDEVHADLLGTDLVKHLVSAEKILIHTKGREAEEVPAPNFIFCTLDAAVLSMDPDARRFRIYKSARAK